MNKGKIYRISDPIQLAEVFFPQKTANLKRAVFLAILFELKNAPGQKLATMDHIPGDYDLSQSSISKVRAKMVRIGLIRKYKGEWIFSSLFANAMSKLIEKVAIYQKPAQSVDESNRERIFVEIAKGTHHQNEITGSKY